MGREVYRKILVVCGAGSLQENTCSVWCGRFTGKYLYCVWREVYRKILVVCVVGGLQENTCSVCGGRFTGIYL